VWGGVGDAFAAMQNLKNKLDPKGILNPGRFLKGLTSTSGL
jgi:FAD/FMN-containing dehydrogenase